MHVLIIPSWYPSQPSDINGCFFREQAIALHKHGCKVGVIYPELCSLRNWKSIFSRQSGISLEVDEGVATYRFKGMNWFPRTVTPVMKLFIWYGLQLYDRYVAQNGLPDVIHVHSLLNAGSLAVEIQKKHAIPFVVTEHSSAFAGGMVSAAGLEIAKKITTMASRKFAVSSAFANLLDKYIGVKEDYWEEMPNIVDERFFSHGLLPNTSKNFKFISVALMSENKCQANIIHAFSKFSKTNPNISLTLGGDGPMRSQLQKLVQDLDLTDRVKFTGMLSREQVLAEMATADAFVLSSRYETFGVVVIEALALGKPVIATRCGGPESIVRKEDGILIPVDDVDALATAMINMVENRNDYDPGKIRQSCIARFSEAAIANRLLNIYSNVAIASTGGH